MGTGTESASKIERLKAELAAEQAKLDEFNSQPESHRLATEIHSKMCRYNHTDACGWDYEKSWDKNSYAHNEYLVKAEKMLQQVTYDDAVKVLDLL